MTGEKTGPPIPKNLLGALHRLGGGEKPPSKHEIPGRLPENVEEWAKAGMVLPRREGEKKVAVCLGDTANYIKNVELPEHARRFIERKVTEEGDFVIDIETRNLNSQQGTRIVLEMLTQGIVRKHVFPNYVMDRIEQYIEAVGSSLRRENKDLKLYRDLNVLAQNVFGFQKAIYTSWTEGPGKGGKQDGAKTMINGLNTTGDFSIWNFLQDPYIESALHRIKGEVNDEAFILGQQRGGKDGLGDVYGGDYGAVEKIAHYLGMFTMLRGLDGSSETAAASYTAYVLLYPKEYFNAGEKYASAPGILMDRSTEAFIAENNEKFSNVGLYRGKYVTPKPKNGGKNNGEKMAFFTNDTRPPVSAFHLPEMIDCIWDNFAVKNKEESPDKAYDNFGWKNVGRMLSLLDGDAYRDPRRNLIGNEKFDQDGLYSLQEFLIAPDKKQDDMAKAAWKIYRDKAWVKPEGLDEKNRKKAESEIEKVQKRILKVNAYRMYYYAEVKEGTFEDRWESLDAVPVKRMAVLNYDEPDGKGNTFVDIGSLIPDSWGNHLSKTILNAYWTAMDYTYNTQNKILDYLAQMKPDKSKFEALREAFTASLGFRNLKESLTSSRERMVELGYERQQAIISWWKWFSPMLEMQMWDDRRNARVRLKWAETINELLRHGYDIDRYIREFEDCGIYNRNWATIDVYNRFGEEEKVAKIMGKMERPDVWGVWLNKIGLTTTLKDSVSTAMRTVNPNWVEPPVPQEWQDVGVTDYWDYLAYNTMVSFAGYKVKENPYMDKDAFGIPVPRVRFSLAFDQNKPEERKNGIFWKQMPEFNSLSDNQKEDLWQGVRNVLIGVHSGRGDSRLVKYGELTETTFAMFLQYYEKMHEELLIDNLIETYLRETYDKDENNWIVNRWGKHLKSKRRWDTWSQMRRAMKYTVGSLSEEKIREETGWYVHDQLATDVDGKILVNDKALPHVVFSTSADPTEQQIGKGYDHIASMTMGSSGVWRVNPELRSPAENYRNFPEIDNIDNPEDAKWAIEKKITDHEQRRRALQEWEYRRRKWVGYGDAGETQQLTWMPICYSKNMYENFGLARTDVAYKYEEMVVNGGENWEMMQGWLGVLDERQRVEFFDKFNEIAEEDSNWVKEEMRRLGIRREILTEFDAKRAKLRVPNVQGKIKEGAPEEAVTNFSKTFIELALVKGIEIGGDLLKNVPVLRSWEEAKSMGAGFLLGAVPTGILVAGSGVLSTMGGAPAIVLAPVAGILLGSQFMDKGFDSHGVEKAYGSLFAGTLGASRLGMYGKRMAARSAEAIAGDEWEPSFNSAFPIKEFMQMVKEHKEKLRPAELK